jgi:hypothetical protein
MKNKGVRDFLENVALAWRAKYPQRARLYLETLKRDKKALVGPSGMSRTGILQFKGAIPADVFTVVERKYPYFFRDHRNMRIFQEIFMGSFSPQK